MPLLREEFQSALAPRDRIPIYQWAARHISLRAPFTRTGAFDISDSRHFIAPFEALQNDYRREVNILKPLRGGGSLIGDIFAAYAISEEPGPYLDVFQSDPIARDHASKRSKPIFEQCSPVAELFPANPDDNCANWIKFTNGTTWQACGPSLGNLQSRGFRYLRLEEIWMWPQDRLGEALGRVGDYLKLQTSKVLCISQAGPVEGVPMEESDWYRHYHSAAIFEWEVQCPGCQKYYDPIFSGTNPDGTFWGITWDKHQKPGGDWDLAKCIPTIRFECPHCRHALLDNPRTKSEWNRTGRYRHAGGEMAPGPAAKKESLHWEAVIDYPWEDLVQLWLDACNAEKRGNLGPKLQFYQKRRAIFKDEESLLKGGLNLIRAAYEISVDTTKWPEEKARFLTIDRQSEDLFWYTIRAWSPEKSRRLLFGKCYGFGALEEIREKWKVPPLHTFIDSGYLPKGDHGVYAACLKYGWVAIRGSGEHQFIHRIQRGGKTVSVLRSYSPVSYGDPEIGIRGGRRKHCNLIHFSKSQMNQKVQELIDAGLWEEPVEGEDPEVEKEYNAQMGARVKKREYQIKTGETKVYWKESQNDHARDCANGQVLGAVLRSLVPDPATEIQTKTEKEQNK